MKSYNERILDDDAMNIVLLRFRKNNAKSFQQEVLTSETGHE